MASVHQTHEILLLPFFGQGHLFPFIELTKHLYSLNFATTLLIPSFLSYSIPSSLHHDHQLIRIVEIPSSASAHDPPPRPGPMGGPHEELVKGIESFLSAQTTRPTYVVMDIMMGWAKDIFKMFDIPIVALFTSGACSAALEHGSWKAHVSDLKPGEARVIPGLPEEMNITFFYLKRQAHQHPPPHHSPHGAGNDIPPPGPRPPKPDKNGFRGPPHPGQEPMWMSELEGTVGVMINTCHELEGIFLDYLAKHIGKPVWGVGPLLPDEYCRSTGELVHDHSIRANKQSSCTEEDVVWWLDHKPRQSVIYISFGSEVQPTSDEYAELSEALQEIDWSFIWVIQSSSQRPGPPPPPTKGKSDLASIHAYYPDGLASKVGGRGLIIDGWAPQLLILSHPSIGGFVSHCGWNSAMEAVGRGIPLLAWPIRGDQHHNAKLVVSYLKVGYMVKDDASSSEMVKKDEIVHAIDKLMTDQSIKQHANVIQDKFNSGFPQSSTSAFNAFRNFIASVERESTVGCD